MPRRRLPLRRFRHILEGPAVRSLELAAGVLPRTWLWALAELAGGTLAILPSRANVIFSRHMRNIMIPNGIHIKRSAVYRNLVGGMLDFVHLSRKTDAEFLEVVEVKGASNMAEALRAGRGVLAITAHLAGWELIPRAMALLGHRVGIVGRRISGNASAGLIERLRTKPGIEAIDRAGGGAALLRALRGNTAVGILIDQDTTAVEGGFVDFFGIPALTPTGPAKIATRFGIPVVPLFIRRMRDGRYEIDVEEPILQGRFSGPGAVEALTGFLTSRIEARIRLSPDQWVWFHERWCRRPPGAPGLR